MYNRYQQEEFELLPAFELDNKSWSPNKPFPKQTEGKESEACQADPATGWETDNESFTKRAAELHLKSVYRVQESIEKVSGCLIDPDFYTRRCEFMTAKKIKGAVLWIPMKKQVYVTACVNGKKRLCWYDYFIGRDGRLYIKNRKCLGKDCACNP